MADAVYWRGLGGKVGGVVLLVMDLNFEAQPFLAAEMFFTTTYS